MIRSGPQTIQLPLSWTKNRSPTTAGVTVSEAELPSPWSILMAIVALYPVSIIPRLEAPERSRVDRFRISRRPKTLARGTQKTLPKPRIRTLNYAWSLASDIVIGAYRHSLPTPAGSGPASASDPGGTRGSKAAELAQWRTRCSWKRRRSTPPRPYTSPSSIAASSTGPLDRPTGSGT